MTTTSPSFRRDEIQVWSMPLAISSRASRYCLSVLSDDEKERAFRYHHVRNYERFIAGRAALRILLASYIDCPPAKIRFLHSEDGRPSLSYGARTVTDFNLSHSQDEMIIVISGVRRVGVDIEHVDVGRCAAQEWISVLSSAELRWCANTSDGERTRKYLTLWTRKEALLKADGRGLLVDPLRLDLSGSVHAGVTPVFFSSKFLAPSQWTLWEMALGGQLVGSLATEGWSTNPKISYAHFPTHISTLPSFDTVSLAAAH